MNNKLEKILDFIKKTGDKAIVFHQDDGFVVMKLDDYGYLLGQNSVIGDLSEGEMLARINRDIALWRESQPCDRTNADDFLLDKRDDFSGNTFSDNKDNNDWPKELENSAESLGEKSDGELDFDDLRDDDDDDDDDDYYDDNYNDGKDIAGTGNTDNDEKESGIDIESDNFEIQSSVDNFDDSDDLFDEDDFNQDKEDKLDKINNFGHLNPADTEFKENHKDYEDLLNFDEDLSNISKKSEDRDDEYNVPPPPPNINAT
ncbi:MAG: hypothetical protein ABIJ91_02365 [Candidatus Kuenenbacteria bacterium]